MDVYRVLPEGHTWTRGLAVLSGRLSQCPHFTGKCQMSTLRDESCLRLRRAYAGELASDPAGDQGWPPYQGLSGVWQYTAPVAPTLWAQSKDSDMDFTDLSGEASGLLAEEVLHSNLDV